MDAGCSRCDRDHPRGAPECPGQRVGKVFAGKYRVLRPLGSGATIGRGSFLNPAVFELLHETAEAEKLPFTVEASGRQTGTDADAVHLSRGGVATGLVSVPVRYMHSPDELVDIADIDAAAQLLAGFAARLTARTKFPR